MQASDLLEKKILSIDSKGNYLLLENDHIKCKCSGRNMQGNLIFRIEE